MTSDLDLLEQFARRHSQDAFAEIVRRHVNLVYSAALRQVRAPQLAEEVSQSVFTDLARQAEKLSRPADNPPLLTAWLYAVTRRTAVDVIRKESRRQQREQAAAEMRAMNATANDWDQIEPLLDDAMAGLEEVDRTAILLRYFENKNLREVGEQLNITDDAAQKRVSRAVEKLREFFSKRNVTVGASVLVVLLSANAVKAAPAGLVLSAAHLAQAAVTTMNAMKITFATKLKLAFGAVLLIGAATAWTVQHRQQARLQLENEALHQQIAQLETQRAKLSDHLAANDEAGKLSAGQFEELLKLRGEIGVLRRQLDTARSPNVNTVVTEAGTNQPTPQIHIKARFISVPRGTMDDLAGSPASAGGFTLMLDNENTRTMLQALAARDAEILGEPEVMTTSGQRTQLRATQFLNVTTNFCLQETNGSVSILPQKAPMETGVTLEVVPRALPDGYTVELRASPSVTSFLGYAPVTNTISAYASDGREVDLPAISPQFQVQQTTNVMNVLDGQTLVLGLTGNQIPTDAAFVQLDGTRTNYPDKQIFVFMTSSLVDAAGNLIHKDSGTYTNLPPQ